MRKRSVVLVGQAGVGKSIVANHLVGHDPLSPDEPPFQVSHGAEVLASVTREVQHKTGEFMWENDFYRVTVRAVDMFDIGILFGQVPLFDTLAQYFRETKQRIDLILFVVKNGRLTQEEKTCCST